MNIISTKGDYLQVKAFRVFEKNGMTYISVSVVNPVGKTIRKTLSLNEDARFIDFGISVDENNLIYVDDEHGNPVYGCISIEQEFGDYNRQMVLDRLEEMINDLNPTAKAHTIRRYAKARV